MNTDPSQSSSSPKEMIEAEKVYNGTLVLPSQQFRIRSTLSYELEIPAMPPEFSEEQWSELWDSAKKLAVQKPDQETDQEIVIYPPAIKDAILSLRSHLNPENINLHTFGEDRGIWPTIGQVYDYTTWLISPETPAHPLNEFESMAQIGDIQNTALINVKNRQPLEMLKFIILVEYFLKILNGDEPSKKFETLSFSELLSFRDQVTGAIAPGALNSDLMNQFAQVRSQIPGLNQSIQSFEMFKNYMKEIIETRMLYIECIKNLSDKDLTEGNIEDDHGLIRSLSQDQLLAIYPQFKNKNPKHLGLMLSAVAVADWKSFLGKLGFQHWEANLSSCLMILGAVPEDNWPALLDLPGFREALSAAALACQGALIDPNPFDEVPETLRYKALMLLPVDQFLSAVVLDIDSLVHFIGPFDVENLPKILLQPGLRKGLEIISKDEVQLSKLLVALASALGVSSFIEVMLIDLLFDAIVNKGKLSLLGTTVPAQYAYAYSLQPSVSEKLVLSMSNYGHIEMVLLMHPNVRRLAILQRPDVLEKIRSRSFSAFALADIAGACENKLDLVLASGVFSHLPQEAVSLSRRYHQKKMSLFPKERTYSLAETISLANVCFEALAEFFAEIETLPFLIEADDFLPVNDEAQLLVFLSMLPVEYWPRLFSLPKMDQKFIGFNSDQIFTALCSFQNEKAFAFVSLPQIRAKTPDYSYRLFLTILTLIPDNLSEYFAFPEVRQDLIPMFRQKFLQDCAKLGQGEQGPAKLSAFLSSQQIKNYLGILFPDALVFSSWLGSLPENIPFFLLLDNPELKPAFFRFVVSDQAEPIFEVLKNCKPTSEQELGLLTVLKAMYSMVDQQEEGSSYQYKRFHFFNTAVEKPDRPFLELLEQRVKLNHPTAQHRQL